MSYTSLRHNLNPLLPEFDGFGWIPCRGSLSLDLVQNLSLTKKTHPHIPGDVDRFLVAFKDDHIGFNSEWFIASTSIAATYDTKTRGYSRTFRYFLTGSVNNDTCNCTFWESHKRDRDIKEILDTEGAFIGTLIIVQELTTLISEQEIQIINAIKELRAHFAEKTKKERKEKKYDWASINKLRCTIEELIKNMPHRIANVSFPFEVFLSRDGILLLKDARENTDYTRQKPLPSIFLEAMNYKSIYFILIIITWLIMMHAFPFQISTLSNCLMVIFIIFLDIN